MPSQSPKCLSHNINSIGQVIKMEVYSIMGDLQQPDTSSRGRLLQQALTRNKYLLQRYTLSFKHKSASQFRAQIRLALKQFRSSPDLLYSQRYSSREMYEKLEAKKRRTQVLEPIKFQCADDTRGSCKNIARVSVFRGIENTERRRTEKLQVRQTKRSSAQLQSCKIKNISLGEDIEQTQQKLKSYLHDRYKTTLTRLKNLYCNQKGSPAIQYSFKLRPSYFINHSLAEYISKNLTRH